MTWDPKQAFDAVAAFYAANSSHSLQVYRDWQRWLLSWCHNRLFSSPPTCGNWRPVR